MFVKAPWAPIYTNFEREISKECNLFGQNFPKSAKNCEMQPKTAFSKKGQKLHIWSKLGLPSNLGALGNSIWST